ncbi:MAG: nicotinate-nucleotide adenylyltransferase [Gammaproteobacteria bacterium]|nr:nicotinate-nucleotide adenylyltransferase [Gammaproteobacteria bacterium]
MTSPSVIAVMGGMFDPVHIGHLRSAIEVLSSFKFKELRLVPCARPPHRQSALASAEHRINMLRQAISWNDKLVIEECEVWRTTASYTIETLRYIKTVMHGAPLCLIVGEDAFRSLPTWHQWRELFSLANILVLQRSGVESGLQDISDELDAALAGRVNSEQENFLKSRAGNIFFYPVTQLQISSTRIRTLLAAEENVKYLVPDAVINYIAEHDLYAEHNVNQK